MNLPRPQTSASLAWIAFACCACLVIGAMLWLTHNVIETERERAEAEIRAELQERVRLSLWRMDSLGTSILLEENSIHPQLFLSSPTSSLPTITRFETPDGAGIKGQGNQQDLDRIATILPSLISSHKRKEETLPKEPEIPAPALEQSSYPMIQKKMRGDEKSQELANAQEAQDRSRWVDRAVANQSDYSASEMAKEKKLEAARTPSAFAGAAELKLAEETGDVTALLDSTPKDGTSNSYTDSEETQNPIGDFKPSWFEGSLFLIRRGMVITTFAQGTLINHEALADLLRAEALRLLPNAKLTPPQKDCDNSFVLASFPFQLHPGSIGIAPDSIPRSISVSLLAGWVAALTALLTAYFLIANMMKLSERRASFVSAVTHELRTPLTTFRLYSDMLSSGAVREEKKPVYLNVLSREADRLSHLVENVLAFSQIERGSARSKVTEIEINSFLETLRERFESRLESAGLKLEMEQCPSFQCKLDTSALEHILFNLIDNAAKYAATSNPPIITISPTTKSCSLEIHVSDYGPGIPETEARRIFRPFHKSAEQAAETKPGIGLGLALSKRLANSMGGSLSCSKRKDGLSGAVFILHVPCNGVTKS